MKKIMTITFKTLLGILLFFIIYGICVFIFSNITVNKNYSVEGPEKIEIFVKTNGFHTDLVLPVKNEYKDWTSTFDTTLTKSSDKNFNYVAVGWGDKGFYINTPDIDSLKFSTVFNAAFFLSESAVHVTYLNSIKESNNCRKILIDKNSYYKIIDHIDNSLDKENDKVIPINFSYSNNDLFFEGRGKYNLFYTCNTWTNNCMKKAGLKSRFWTLTEKPIMDNYR
jgi:uncharacterized protein (TIGR02117 family)